MRLGFHLCVLQDLLGVQVRPPHVTMLGMRTGNRRSPTTRSAARPGRVLPFQLENLPGHEAHAAILAAVCDGGLTIGEAKALVEIVYRGLTISDAKAMADRIQLIEAKAMEAARIAGRALALPSQRVVEAQPAATESAPRGG